jgi:RNA polymerase sigma factor (sigma-70 family)
MSWRDPTTELVMATPRLSSVHSSNSPALAELIARRPRFHAYLRSRVGTAATADDLLQAAYLRILERGLDLRDDGALVGWFYRVLRNAAIDHARINAGRQRLGHVFAHQVPTTVLPDDTAERAATAECTRNAIASLPAPQRRALELVYLAGGSVADLAAQDGVTKNAATVRLHRARAALRTALASQPCSARVSLAA